MKDVFDVVQSIKKIDLATFVVFNDQLYVLSSYPRFRYQKLNEPSGLNNYAPQYFEEIRSDNWWIQGYNTWYIKENKTLGWVWHEVLDIVSYEIYNQDTHVHLADKWELLNSLINDHYGMHTWQFDENGRSL